MPIGNGERRREVTSQELSALLSGTDLIQAKRLQRYERKRRSAA